MGKKGFRGGTPTWDLSFISIFRSIKLLLIPFIVYSLGMLPSIAFLLYSFRFFNFFQAWNWIFLPFFLIFSFFLFIVFETLIPGIFIRILPLKIDEGEHEISIKNKNFYRYSLYFILYRPALKIVTFLPLIPLRTMFYRIVGLKFGKNTLFAGSELIHDPPTIEIGDNTLIGGWSQITGHIGERKLYVKKVKIGNNCLIGGKSIIFPGVIIEDDVTVALGSVVLKNKILKKGKIYGGVPVKVIGSNLKNKK